MSSKCQSALVVINDKGGIRRAGLVTKPEDQSIAVSLTQRAIRALEFAKSGNYPGIRFIPTSYIDTIIQRLREGLAQLPEGHNFETGEPLHVTLAVRIAGQILFLYWVMQTRQAI